MERFADMDSRTIAYRLASLAREYDIYRKETFTIWKENDRLK